MNRFALASRIVGASVCVIALASGMTCNDNKLPLGLSIGAPAKLVFSV
jgi:hypothetical protein